MIVATALLAIALTGIASAAPTTIPLTSTGIKVIAAPGTQNQVSITYGVFEQGTDGFHIDAQFISDSAGITVESGEGQVCTAPVGNATACVDTGTTAGVPDGSTGTGENPTIRLGDLDDTLTSDNVGDLDVRGGPGDDTMTGGSRPIVVGAFEGEPGETITSEELFAGQGGDDTLRGNGQPDSLDGGGGNDRLIGGPGRDTLAGGPGNDRLDARGGVVDAHIDCGPGRDVLRVDGPRPRPTGCEVVMRSGAPSTRSAHASAKTHVYSVEVTIKVDRAAHRIGGTVESDAPGQFCELSKVRVRQVTPGKDRVAAFLTPYAGLWGMPVRQKLRGERVYAEVSAYHLPSRPVRCLAARSRTVVAR